MSRPRRDSTQHLIGLLLGTEDDWPLAFETLTRRLGPVPHQGREHQLTTERLTIEPFDLRDPVRPDLVIDRLGWWYYHPREWLKKAALVNDTYLLNNPFTFQAMEKHSAYCAMMRLGFDIPNTMLVPYKNPLDHEKWAYTAQKYNLPFELDAVADRVGYPMDMKPFDGGAWRGVSRVDDGKALHEAYDRSGQMLMHLQAAVSPFDAFARSLTIGPETKIMKFRPELPMHDRYEVVHSFLPPEAGMEILTLSRTINAFFRWEFNSCEALVTGTRVQPIDYANACPDIAITSLHYYFPWAITQLISWSVFCAVTNRRPRVDTTSREWFDVADDPDLSWNDKLGRYALLADQYFQADEYREFCSTSLASLPNLVYDWIDSPDFDDLLVETVRKTYPRAEHDRFLDHFRGLMKLWVADQT
ncbi:MAG: ATP-grasp domain-containing protein [Nakamurella sp.]